MQGKGSEENKISSFLYTIRAQLVDLDYLTMDMASRSVSFAGYAFHCIPSNLCNTDNVVPSSRCIRDFPKDSLP